MKKSMVKLFRVISVVLVFAMMVTAVDVNVASVKAKKKKNVVIFYFSATGTTKGAAKKIKRLQRAR